MVKYQRDFSMLGLKEEAQLEEEEDLKRMKNDEFYLEPCNFQHSYRCVTLDALW
jgi:hypothetical protein